MNRFEFEKWVLKYCPEGMDIDDFVENLACGAIAIVEEVHRKTKQPIRELVEGFRPKDIHQH